MVSLVSATAARVGTCSRGTPAAHHAWQAPEHYGPGQLHTRLFSRYHGAALLRLLAANLTASHLRFHTKARITPLPKPHPPACLCSRPSRPWRAGLPSPRLLLRPRPWGWQPRSAPRPCMQPIILSVIPAFRRNYETVRASCTLKHAAPIEWRQDPSPSWCAAHRDI